MGVRAHRGGDGGQIAPLMVFVVVIGLVGVLVVARLVGAADDAARARTAADAAALAGATNGATAAAAMAEANDGRLVSFGQTGSVVEVVVEVGDAAARARAEVTVDWVP